MTTELNRRHLLIGLAAASSAGAGARASNASGLAIPAKIQGTHSQWLVECRDMLAAATLAPDNSPESAALWERHQDLSKKLATTPAETKQDLVAQIEWFRDDLGDYILGNASDEHNRIFDTLLASVDRIAT